MSLMLTQPEAIFHLRSPELATARSKIAEVVGKEGRVIFSKLLLVLIL